jgi:hypothetical protein
MPDDTDQFLGLSKHPAPQPLPSLPILAGPGWAAAPNKQRAVLFGSTVLQREAGDAGAGDCALDAGTEVDLGQVKWHYGKKWTSVTLRDGRQGFVPAETKVRKLMQVELHPATTVVLPSVGASTAEGWELKKGERILLVEPVAVGGRDWVRIRDSRGREGFIGDDVKFRPVETAHSSGRDMAVGALWCIGGIVVTAVTYSSAAAGGGRYIVAWGAIVFGGIQFLKGLARSMSE